VQAMNGHLVGRLMAVPRDARGGLRGRPRHDPPAHERRRPRRRLAAAAPGGRGPRRAADGVTARPGVLRGQGRRCALVRATVLPELSARLAVTQATDASLMQLDEAAF
jgi:hypothetical protein